MLGVGAIVISFFAIALNAVSAFSPADPMAGAFAGAVFVLLSACWCSVCSSSGRSERSRVPGHVGGAIIRAVRLMG